MNRKTLTLAVGLSLFLAAARANAAYLPAPEQRAKLEALLAAYGTYFPAGRMLEVGDSRKRSGAVVYWYKFGDDTIRWRVEEWVPLPRGLFHLRVWDFREDFATVNEDIVDGGIFREIRFAEPIPLDGKEAAGVSQLAIKILLEADPSEYNREPYPNIGPH